MANDAPSSKPFLYKRYAITTIVNKSVTSQSTFIDLATY